MFENIIAGFSISMTPSNLLYCLLGVTIGNIVGVLPGIGPISSIALLLPLTYHIDVVPAIIMLAGIYYGSQYGGTITSILMNVPGEASTVVTCIDGYQMAKKGKAGAALGIATFGSFIAGTLGIIATMLLAPPLAKVALIMGPPEQTALMIAGLTLVMYLSSKSFLKSLITGILGLLLGTVGMDTMTGIPRFTFGSSTLMDGFDLAPMGMGLFGIAEVLMMVEEKEKGRSFVPLGKKLREILPNKEEWRLSIGPIGRGSILGFFLGVLPGGGAVLSSFISYGVEKRLSKHPEKFGTGAIEGVAGPESANNAASQGAFVPLLVLGIPSNAVIALLMGGLMIHGITPGPLFLRDHPATFWSVITSMYIGNVLLVLLNIPLIGLFVRILTVPKEIMATMITLFCFIGAYSISNNPTHILILIIFGFIGYIMRKFEFDPAPLILAFVLGPLLEDALRQSLMLFKGNVLEICHRPIALGFLLLAIFLMVSPIITSLRRRFMG